MVRFTKDTIRKFRAEQRLPPSVPEGYNYNRTSEMRENERQRMIAFIKKRRNSPNNLPNVNKNNISTYYNSNFDNVESRNIHKNKRVYISTDVINGRVKQVYNQDGIIEYLLRTKTNEFARRSPVSRKKFWIKHVIPM